MARWLIAALVVGALGCHDEFEAPEKPDLYKVPRDLGLDLGAEDLSGQLDDRDLAVPEAKDLAHADQT